MYKRFNEFPEGLRARLIRVLGGDLNEKVHEPVPALKNCSILETMNMPDGEARLNSYLDKSESVFG